MHPPSRVASVINRRLTYSNDRHAICRLRERSASDASVYNETWTGVRLLSCPLGSLLSVLSTLFPGACACVREISCACWAGNEVTRIAEAIRRRQLRDTTIAD